MRATEELILQRAEDAIERLGLRWELVGKEPLVGQKRADAILRLQHPTGEIEFVVEIKARPNQHVAEALPRTGLHDTPLLLIADYINPKLAERLRQREVNFVDAAGNAFLRQEGLYVFVKGERDNLRLEAERERRRAFRPSGLKLLFALLCRPELAEADYRTLAETVGIALGTVQWVMRDLIRDGYVLKLGRFERRLVEPKELLEAWVPAYARDLRPRLLLGRFEAEDIRWWQGTDLQPHDAWWGGEPAAAVLTKYLKPGTLTVYAETVPARLIAEQRLKKDEAGRIEFRKRFWHFEMDERGQTVPPILVYADLLALGDPRARETAERLYEEMIDGPFRAHLARWDR
ncbi:MAG: type IV toxin-antitoxin system AbiEi family antitoxin [Thermoanaerobaculia bacterium]